MFSYGRWYAENKERLSAVRRRRYRQDPEYKKRVRARAQATYLARRNARGVNDRRDIVTVDGERLLSIGKLCKLCKRNPQTIRNYHRDGVFPDPQFFDTRGWRLYTPHQVSLIRSVLRRFDQGELKSLEEVSFIVKDGWEGENK